MLTAWLVITATAALAETITGRVVSIHDGDTLTVLVAKRQVKVRLADIDAPGPNSRSAHGPDNYSPIFASANRLGSIPLERIETGGRSQLFTAPVSTPMRNR